MFLDNPLFNLADSRLLMTAIPPDLHGQDDLPQVLFVGKEWRGGGKVRRHIHTLCTNGANWEHMSEHS